MAEAYINGQAVARDAAIAAAGRLLTSASRPLICGLAADAAAIRLGLRIARHLQAPVDHAQGDVLARASRVRARNGTMVTTPQEARRLADVIVFAGGSLAADDDGLFDYIVAGAARHFVCLGAKAEAAALRRRGSEITSIAAATEADIAAQLATLRAVHAGRLAKPPAEIRKAADILRQAKFGIIVYSAATLGSGSMEMILGLADDLNSRGRFSTVPAPALANGEAAQQICAWTFGVPLRSRWLGDRVEHDPWRYDPERLVVAGEVDAALWIGPLENPPDWLDGIPTAVLAGRGFAPDRMPEVAIAVGRPGVDYAAVMHHAPTNGLSFMPATRPSAAPTGGEILAALFEQVQAAGARP